MCTELSPPSFSNGHPGPDGQFKMRRGLSHFLSQGLLAGAIPLPVSERTGNVLGREGPGKVVGTQVQLGVEDGAEVWKEGM